MAVSRMWTMNDKGDGEFFQERRGKVRGPSGMPSWKCSGGRWKFGAWSSIPASLNPLGRLGVELVEEGLGNQPLSLSTLVLSGGGRWNHLGTYSEHISRPRPSAVVQWVWSGVWQSAFISGSCVERGRLQQDHTVRCVALNGSGCHSMSLLSGSIW